MALQRFPLRVEKIAWVIGSHPFSLSHERSFAHFQNTLLGRLPSDLRSLVPGTRCSLQVFFPAHEANYLFSCEEALDVVGSLPARAHEDLGNNAGIMR
jgi:hypothetical protein